MAGRTSRIPRTAHTSKNKIKIYLTISDDENVDDFFQTMH